MSDSLIDSCTATFRCEFRPRSIGIIFGGTAGVILGYSFGKSRLLEKFFSPFIIAYQNTPIIILAPILIIWAGTGYVPGIIIASLSALYPMMIAVFTGVRSIERIYKELFDSLKSNQWQRFVLLELPSNLYPILSNLRLSINLSLIGSLVWEFIDNNQRGLGFLMNQAGFS